MRFLLSTLSLSYLTRHKVKSLLTLLGVVVGVATFSAIRSAQDTLTTGIRGTVDRMAGKAQLQISAEGGVPEELQEQIRELPGIRAQSPVIEQVVSGLEGVTNASEIGSVLVLGVDLLGDREMRDYGFEGSEEDLDDPLLFLAQADSVALARPLAERAGVKVGESLVLRAPEGPKRVVVRGLLSPKGFAEAFGGNLVVMDVYAAQSLFGRGRRFDRIELRLEEGTPLDAATGVLEKALGPGFQVETPAMRGAQMEQLVTNFVAGFSISSGFALCIGTFLIFNSFTVSVNRRRRDIGTLRSLGATPRQIQTLFLAEAALVGLVGGALGVLAGGALADGFLKIMGGTANTVYGVADSSRHASLTLEVVLTSLAVGLAASLAGAFAPARAAARVPPTEAFAKGTYLASVPGSPARRIAAGLALLAVAVAVALVLPVAAMPLVLLVLALAIAGAVLFAGPLSRLVLERCAGLLSRLAPVSGPLALDSLLGNPRRTAGTVTALTLSLAFVLGLGAYMDSTKKVMVRWMDDILTSDLYVRASANLVRPEFRYPATVREELLAIPGVRAVESYRGARIPYRGKSVLFMSIEVDAMMARTRHEYLQGNREEMLRGLVSEGKCAVSDNFHRLFSVNVGDVLTLAGPKGLVKLPVAAVFRDFGSDKGALLVDRKTFIEHWGDDRVDTYDLSTAEGADVSAVRNEIRRRFSGRFPALVSTRREFVAEIGRAIDGFYALVRITVFLALAVAFLGIVTALLISVAERTREIGILKALGALGPQIARGVVVEALAIAAVSYLVALPLGHLMSRFMETTVAELFAGWHMPHAMPWTLYGELLLLLPTVSLLASFFPARVAVRTKVTEAIEYE